MHYHTWLIHTYIFVQCHIYIITYIFLGIFKVFFVVHTFIHSTWETEAGRSLESEVSLVL